MSFLRVGTSCAVFDDEQRILLSRRGDMDVWNLPTGRLDAGEVLADAAAREAREETGVIVNIERPVGLYYFQATQRLNVLYTAFPVGGELVHRTEETTENLYFHLDTLPGSLFAAYMAQDAAADQLKALHIHHTPRLEIIKLRLNLARRYVMNLLRGRPEPKHVRFHVRVVGVIWDEAHRRVLTVPGKHEQVLPFLTCDGRQAPWLALQRGVKTWFGIQPDFSWVGIWQQPTQNAIELIFAATAEQEQQLLAHHAEWTAVQNAALIGRDAQYVQRIKPTYRDDPVWTIVHEDEIAAIRIVSSS